MKTGEENFDDEVRQKLRHSEVVPPAGFFDQIIPPSDNRKGFLWIWVSGILLLIITAGVIGYTNFEENNKLKKSATGTEIKGNSLNQVYSGTSGTENKSNFDDNLEEEEKINSAEETASLESGTSHSEKKIQNKSENTSEITSKYFSGHTISGNYKKRPGNSEKFESGIYNNAVASTNINYNYDLLFVPLPSLPYNERPEVKQQLHTNKPQILVFDSHTSSPYSLEIKASKIYGSANKSLVTDDSLSQRLFNAVSNNMLNSSGYELSAGINYSLNKKFTIGASLHYGQRTQDFNINYKEILYSFHLDTIQYYILFPFAPSQLITTYDTSIVESAVLHDIKHDVTFKTAGISLEIRYTLTAGAFLIEPGAGVFADVINSVKGSTNYNTKFKKQRAKNFYSNSIQASLAGNIRFSYPCSEKINLFIEPSYRYGLTSVTTSGDFYKEKTNLFSVGAGIKYIIFNKQAAK